MWIFKMFQGSYTETEKDNFIDPAFLDDSPLYNVQRQCASNSTFSVSIPIPQTTFGFPKGINLWPYEWDSSRNPNVSVIKFMVHIMLLDVNTWMDLFCYGHAECKFETWEYWTQIFSRILNVCVLANMYKGSFF